MFKRIVSLAPSISESICSLGKSEHLIGVSDFCNFPDFCNSLPKIGGFASPDVAKILSLKPDLILATTLHHSQKLQIFRDNSIEVVQINAQNLFEAPNAIRQIGKALDIEEKAESLAEKLQAEINAILEQGKLLKKTKKVCYLCTSSKFCNHKPKCQTNNLVRLLGGELCSYTKKNIVQDIVNSKPEIIIIPYAKDTNDWKTQNSFIESNYELQQIKAFKNKKIHSFNGDLLSRPGPRAAEGLKQLFNLIHQ